MLGRKSYTVEELDEARAEVARQLATYKKVAKLAGSATTKVSSTLEEFEALFFNNMALALDRRFVHRLRLVSGKDGNALWPVHHPSARTKTCHPPQR